MTNTVPTVSVVNLENEFIHISVWSCGTKRNVISVLLKLKHKLTAVTAAYLNCRFLCCQSSKHTPRRPRNSRKYDEHFLHFGTVSSSAVTSYKACFKYDAKTISCLCCFILRWQFNCYPSLGNMLTVHSSGPLHL